MTWDWPQIANIASVLGVIGGLISLIFVIFGLRRNARATEGATVQALMSLEKDVYALLLAHAPTFRQGCADRAKLAPDDLFRFDRLVNAQMSLFYSAFEQHRQNLIDAEVWQAYENAMREDLSGPGFLASWTAMANNYPKSFTRFVAGR